MRKLLFFILLIFLPLLVEKGSARNVCGTDDDQLVVLMADGSKIYFLLSERPKITFAEQNMRISSTSKTEEIEIANVSKFYTSNTANVIHDLKGNDLRVIYNNGDRILIEGATTGIKLYGIDGKELTNHINYSGDNAIISLSSLHSGVYILNTGNNQSLKIYKR